MKALSSILIAVGLVLLVYAVLGRFTGAATLGFFRILPTMRATAVIAAVNTIFLLAILLKVYEKK